MRRPSRALKQCSLLIITAFSLSSGPARAAEQAAGYLAFGDLRGHLEPCGCDPATDLGGIKRLGVVLQRERSLHPDVLVFDLGNDVPTDQESDLKTPFLAAASAALQPNAALLNNLELARLKILGTLARRTPAGPNGSSRTLPPYLLSNAVAASPAAALAATTRSGPGWIALGYVAPSASPTPELLPLDQKRLNQWRGWLNPHQGDYKVLLFSGPDADLDTILAAKLFDAIISSNVRPLSDLPGPEEKQDEKRLVRRSAPPVAMVPLGGQGLLRGGALQFNEAKPLTQLLQSAPPATTAPADPATWLSKTPTLVTWMSTEDEQLNGPLNELYQKYNAAARSDFARRGESRLAALKTSPFAGAAACVSCHAAPAKVYQASKHAHAMQTLVDKGKQEDAECVACHAVGAKVAGGFVSLAASPQLANVQCENCHGPRLAHARDPAKAPKPTVAAHDMCVTCHNKQHSPNFDFKTYWPRIVH